MIDFRYHLVSIVAVFLALAIGIVLGSTELQGPTYSILNHTTATLQNQLGQARSQLATAQQQASQDEAYAQAVEPAVLHDLLNGQRLLIVTEPGAQSSVVSGISTAAVMAGATVTGQINLASKFFDAAQVIASEILTAPATSSGSAGNRSAGGDQATNATTMLQAYAASQFLSTTGQPTTPATLTVVVTPQNAPSDGSADPLDQVLIPVVQELAAKSSATVVVGSSSGSGSGSPIAVLRSNNASNQVSTVDDAELVSGQTAAIQALATLLAGGKAASYGFTANGASAVAPSPAPTPSVSVSVSASATSTPTKKAKK